jgi:hypothetical protein
MQTEPEEQASADRFQRKFSEFAELDLGTCW